ncbi:MAG: hypothetical protein K8I00_10530, partial [Candidatus Omnitrophica bacterium]|nr:hypothetical protein [Candidatus Omnitrophota bacterium]
MERLSSARGIWKRRSKNYWRRERGKEDNINFLVFARFLIGLIFVVSGFEKIITPYQNFQYVIQAYELFPEFAEAIIARTFPWVELITG